MKLYSVYDEVAQTFNAPFPEANDNCAIRAFASVAGDPASIICKHPGDYYLYCIGDMEEHSGELSSVAPQRLCRGTDFSKEVENV